MAVLGIAGPLKGRCRAPLKGFGVDTGQVRAGPYENCLALSKKMGLLFVGLPIIRALLLQFYVNAGNSQIGNEKNVVDPPEVYLRTLCNTSMVASVSKATKHRILRVAMSRIVAMASENGVSFQGRCSLSASST